MELRLYFRMIQRGWWIIALTILSALNITLLSLFFATPLYRATARFLVIPNASLSSGQVVTSLGTLNSRSVISTYAEVLESDSVFNDTVALLQITPDELSSYTRSTVVLPSASVLELSVSGPDPHVAAKLANSLGERAIEHAKSLTQVFDLTFLDQATAPGVPFSPQPARDVGLALALGGVVGTALAILREQVRIPLEALRRRMIIDGTSSAYTRRHFERMIDEALAQSKTRGLSLGLIQLDGFHDLIDTLPPLVVQRLLHRVTQTLSKELRGNDSVGRWDDLSFAVLLPATPGAAAARTLERIQQALSRPLELDQNGEVVNLNPHIGVATSSTNQTAKMLIEQTEMALEQARQNGAKTVLFTDELPTLSR